MHPLRIYWFTIITTFSPHTLDYSVGRFSWGIWWSTHIRCDAGVLLIVVPSFSWLTLCPGAYFLFIWIIPLVSGLIGGLHNSMWVVLGQRFPNLALPRTQRHDDSAENSQPNNVYHYYTGISSTWRSNIHHSYDFVLPFSYSVICHYYRHTATFSPLQVVPLQINGCRLFVLLFFLCVKEKWVIYYAFLFDTVKIAVMQHITMSLSKYSPWKYLYL